MSITEVAHRPLEELDHLVTVAAEQAAQADRDGVLSRRVVDALVAAGVPGHFVPARFGGREGSFTEISETMIALGESCASASWVGTMFAYSARFATYLPPPAQEEIWGADPHCICVSGLVPTGTSTAVPGGVRLSGRWNYVSGVEFADWAVLAGPQPGPTSPLPHFHAVPREHLQIERTWDTAGMRATGSHSVTLDDVFVPEHRMVPLPQVIAGRNATSAVVQHNVPLPSVGGLTCIIPAFGAARGALAMTEAVMRGRHAAMAPGAQALFDDTYAHATAELDSVALIIDRIAAALDAGEASAVALRNARDAGFAAQVLRRVMDRVMSVGGTQAHDRHSPLNRCWRDVATGTSHAALRFEKAAGAFTALALGS